MLLNTESSIPIKDLSRSVEISGDQISAHKICSEKATSKMESKRTMGLWEVWQSHVCGLRPISTPPGADQRVSDMIEEEGRRETVSFEIERLGICGGLCRP